METLFPRELLNEWTNIWTDAQETEQSNLENNFAPGRIDFFSRQKIFSQFTGVVNITLFQLGFIENKYNSLSEIRAYTHMNDAASDRPTFDTDAHSLEPRVPISCDGRESNFPLRPSVRSSAGRLVGWKDQGCGSGSGLSPDSGTKKNAERSLKVIYQKKT